MVCSLIQCNHDYSHMYAYQGTMQHEMVHDEVTRSIKGKQKQKVIHLLVSTVEEVHPMHGAQTRSLTRYEHLGRTR